jgi:hypothetical protein
MMAELSRSIGPSLSLGDQETMRRKAEQFETEIAQLESEPQDHPTLQTTEMQMQGPPAEKADDPAGKA